MSIVEQPIIAEQPKSKQPETPPSTRSPCSSPAVSEQTSSEESQSDSEESLCRRMLGKWANHAGALQAAFASADPYPHIVIPNFFKESLAKELLAQFPVPHVDPKTKWWAYNNPLEGKFACDDRSSMPPVFQDLFKLFNDDAFLELMKQVSGVRELEVDPHLHGAGVHYYPSGGTLDMHLDYMVHPKTGKERRLNLLVYLNEEWKKEYGGELLLMPAGEDGEMATTGQGKTVEPAFNQAILFRTTDLSWHGLPGNIASPVDVGRQSVAVYYVSEPRPGVTQRKKARFEAMPGVEEGPGRKKLRAMRPERRIEEADLDEHAPEWQSPMNDYLKLVNDKNPGVFSVCGRKPVLSQTV